MSVAGMPLGARATQTALAEHGFDSGKWHWAMVPAKPPPPEFQIYLPLKNSESREIAYPPALGFLPESEH